MKVEEGQAVFVEDATNSRSVRTYEAHIAKVGRRWAYLEPVHLGRFDVSTMKFDSGAYSSRKRIWRSEEDYRASLIRSKRWRAICEATTRPWSIPPHVTDADLTAMETALGIAHTEDQRAT